MAQGEGSRTCGRGSAEEVLRKRTSHKRFSGSGFRRRVSAEEVRAAPEGPHRRVCLLYTSPSPRD
eukprot:8120008-Alexandrium_andersonii.AAC.1